jgi:hypothetical protein
MKLKHWLFLSSFTLAWCCSLAIILVWQMDHLRKVAELAAMLSIVFTLLLGPGIVGIYLLFGKEVIKNNRLRFYGLIFNAVALPLLALAVPVTIIIATLLKRACL